MRAVSHKSLIKLFDVFETENSLYIVSELMEGSQLLEKLKKKKHFEKKEILIIIQSLLEGVNHFHSKSIMHRDIKPENIMFKTKDSNECVLVDFGLATFTYVKQYIFVRCGTPGYVAPEIANTKNDNDAKYDKKCDVFSVGVLLNFL